MEFDSDENQKRIFSLSLIWKMYQDLIGPIEKERELQEENLNLEVQLRAPRFKRKRPKVQKMKTRWILPPGFPLDAATVS